MAINGYAKLKKLGLRHLHTQEMLINTYQKTSTLDRSPRFHLD